jgi:hypothetical protein
MNTREQKHLFMMLFVSTWKERKVPISIPGDILEIFKKI